MLANIKYLRWEAEGHPLKRGRSKSSHAIREPLLMIKRKRLNSAFEDALTDHIPLILPPPEPIIPPVFNPHPRTLPGFRPPQASLPRRCCGHTQRPAPPGDHRASARPFATGTAGAPRPLPGEGNRGLWARGALSGALRPPHSPLCWQPRSAAAPLPPTRL